MIYHYTNVNAFFNIIKTNKLRLMPSIHTNDPYECYCPKIVFEHVYNNILKNELSPQQRFNLSQFILLQGGNLSLSPIKYLACFSKEKDSLALWNRYGLMFFMLLTLPIGSSFYNSMVIGDLNEFKAICDVTVANRVDVFCCCYG